MGNSQLQQLKTALTAFSGTTEQAARTLMQQSREYDRAAQEVLSLIGGSATGKDREVANAIQSASRAVEQAGEALARASRTAQNYGASI
jgi:ABC-type transporter Mla subunit MlaD